MYLFRIPLIVCLFLIFSAGTSLAQSKVVYRTALNKQLKPLPNENFAFAVEERWKEKGVWKAKLINNETGVIIAEYGYADSTCSIKNGLYTEYMPNRKRKSEVTYNMGAIDGPFAEWYPDAILMQKGNRTGEQLWGHYEYYLPDGTLKYTCETDKQGNGSGREFLAKVGMSGEGMVQNMLQTGTWVYKDSSGRKMMEVLYKENGIEKETCFDANGNPLTGSDCKSDRRPEFPGGKDAWQKFLEKNLSYPKAARKEDIQGAVLIKFLVKEDGSLSGFKVIQSPDPELAAEALRVIRLSPKWTPAIEANKIVPFTEVQSITFKLK